LNAARRRAGNGEFGDPPLDTPLDTLLSAFRQEAELTPIGHLAARGDALSLLVNRLQLQADRARHPEIAAQTVDAPMVITGLPRTGTTLLHALLAEDPAHRAPSAWEVMFPSPPPAVAGEVSRRNRIRRAARRLGWMERLSPGFQAIHEIGAELPQECIAITAHSFVSLRFLVTHDLPSYRKFLAGADHRDAYAFHRHFLQHLQWRSDPRRWVLKAPGHLPHLDALLHTYPDSMVVQTHRDPLESIPSLISLRVNLRRAFSRRADPHRVADEVISDWSDALERASVVRNARPSRQFLDVDYRRLVEHPVDTVAQVYEHFGIEFTAVARDRMNRYMAANPQHKHGLHRYAAQDSDLTAERLAPIRDHWQAARDG